MSVPTSVEELFQLIRKSGMIEDQKLTAYIQRRSAGRGLGDDPRAVCVALCVLRCSFSHDRYKYPLPSPHPSRYHPLPLECTVQYLPRILGWTDCDRRE